MGGGILIDERVQVAAEALAIDRRSGGKSGNDGSGSYELPRQWPQLADGDAVARHDERLPAISARMILPLLFRSSRWLTVLATNQV